MQLRSMIKKKNRKGGKRGKGKVKKESKPDSKLDKERDIERAKANAALWEARLEVTESSRVEYREIARRLAKANEELTNQQYRAEKDVTDVVGFLKQRDLEKEAKIAELEEQLKDQKSKSLEEKEVLVVEYMMKINDLEEKLKKRSGEFRLIQGELKTIKEFRKKKDHMEHEMITIKENMHVAEREHQENLARMEHKFFSEKVRLEKEAEHRIAQLAERAHNEAIVQLDDASRFIFKENVRLNEALGYHLKEAEELKKHNKALTEENSSLTLHKETSELMIKENLLKVAAQQSKISELKDKVASLEQDLALMSTKIEKEKVNVQKQDTINTQACTVELRKLQKLLAIREREMSRVKQLACSIVEQRTELELFFHEALGQVKAQIITNQNQYRQEAMKAYRKQINEARSGRKEYPQIRTFSKAPNSTNSVYTDLEEAERYTHLQNMKLDISELTWEQKERVLRLLFAKMNGLKTRRAGQLPPLSGKKNQGRSEQVAIEGESHMTFITQTSTSDMISTTSRLPDLQST